MQSITTTLKAIRQHRPCGLEHGSTEGYQKLVRFLGKDYGDETPIRFSQIVESNGVDDAYWCLRTLLKEHNNEVLLLQADVAERVLHIYEAKHPNCKKPRQAIEAARAYARGEISKKKLAAARAAAMDAAWVAGRIARDAALAAAWAAARAAAMDAAWVATAAAWDAAETAAWAAARDAAWAAWAAALAAAWDAAWAAARVARDASWAAAWDAARVAARVARDASWAAACVAARVARDDVWVAERKAQAELLIKRFG